MSLRRSARVASSNNNTTRPSSCTAQKRTADDVSTELKPAKKSRASSSSSSNSSNSGVEPVHFKKPEVPVTPRRTGQAGPKVPPLTPTPSFVKLLRGSGHRSSQENGAGGAEQDRAVEPHVTNAVLVTPGGTQKVAYPKKAPPQSTLSTLSPSKPGLPRPVATTGSLLAEAYAHLIRVDGRMKELIDRHHCNAFSAEGLAEKVDPFRSLCNGIISQQVSGAAASSISRKFVALFGDGNGGDDGFFPTPAQVAGTDITRLRSAGLSQRKAEYILGLAQKFRDGELSADALMTASDAEVMEKLIAVRGLGKWSVEMFACFGLKRTDILSTGDLGVQRGMAMYFGRDVNKLRTKGGKWKYMSEEEMLDKSAKYSPYRSLFMWYMWRVVDVDVSAMQNKN